MELPLDPDGRAKRWIERTAEELGINLAGPDDPEPLTCLLLAAAEAAGRLERVTYRTDTTVTVNSLNEGRTLTLKPGEGAFLLSPTGQAVWIAVEGFQ